MKTYELAQVPALMNAKTLSQQEVINYLTEFILNNKPLFNLQLCDEDFISEILIHFLENAKNFLNSYDSTLGNFPSYFYSYIMTMIHSQKKYLARKQDDNRFYFLDYIINSEDKDYTLRQISVSETPKVPYSFKSTTADQLRAVILPKISNIDRKILILVIRYAYFITDEHIHNICNTYKAQEECLFSLIEYVRKIMEKKMERHQALIERRNKAYFYHKKYESQIKYIDESVYITEPEKLKENLKDKNQKHICTWQNHNQKLKEGCLFPHPSNKMIADLLGISERQVCYYLYCAKHKIYISKTEKIIFDSNIKNEEE